jgi:hypothetical protein
VDFILNVGDIGAGNISQLQYVINATGVFSLVIAKLVSILRLLVTYNCT